jgi:hypothetical protein
VSPVVAPELVLLIKSDVLLGQPTIWKYPLFPLWEDAEMST